MYKWFLALEKKSLARGNKSKLDVVVTIFKWIGIVYIGLMMLLFGFSAYEMAEEYFPNQSAILTVSRFIVYYFTVEFTFRFFLQKVPTASIKQYLILNIPRKKIVAFYVGKTFFTAFNTVQLFFLIPFAIMAYTKGESAITVVAWSIGMYCIVLMLHSITIITKAYSPLFYAVVGVVCAGGLLQYYEIVDPTIYTQYIYSLPYVFPASAIAYFLILIIVIYVLYQFYIKRLYLDNFGEGNDNIGRDIQLSWLDNLGGFAPFLRNDIRLILRNKRARVTVILSVLFMGYALLVYNDEVPSTLLLGAFFSTGGFLMMFGQYVPSWDSAYYPLFMTQNVSYVDYLKSKWLIIAFGTLISTVLCFFYYFIYPELFYLIIGMGIYNIGINGYIVLWGGAYLKSPIDLTSSKGVFGDKNAFSLKLLLITLPKMLLPMLFFVIGNLMYPFWGGIGLLILFGIIGLFFNKPIFAKIEQIYKREKYKALIAYKKK